MNILKNVSTEIFNIHTVLSRCMTKQIFLKSELPCLANRFIKYNHLQVCYRKISTITKPLILGIESSCDDTGAAIIDGNGKILSQSLYSQSVKSVMFGGVVPVLSLRIHEENISKVVAESLERADLSIEDLTAIGVTVKPGNVGNLRVGCRHAKMLCRKYKKPLIPVHHMEAHALTVRMIQKVEFPFFVVLISGGHFIFAVARGIGDWVTLMNVHRGEPPGVALDQIARRLKLKNLKQYENVCGGRAIELAAKDGSCEKYKYPVAKKSHMSLFSLCGEFSGIKGFTLTLIEELERKEGIKGGNLISSYKDICACVQHAAMKLIVRQTQKAMACARHMDLISEDTQRMVFSGGVACNEYIRNGLERLCEFEEYSLHIPPPELCTDNGVMIAWTALEQWRTNTNILHTEDDYANLRVETESPLGCEINSIEFRNVPKPVYMKL